MGGLARLAGSRHTHVRKGRRRRHVARLIQGYLERKRVNVLSDHFKEINNILPHHKGVYALYDHDKLYYVGIARRNLARRILGHTRDRHRNKWNRFSLYVCKSVKTIAALEKLFLRIAKPPGNGQIGRLRSRNLKHDLEKELRAAIDIKLA